MKLSLIVLALCGSACSSSPSPPGNLVLTTSLEDNTFTTLTAVFLHLFVGGDKSGVDPSLKGQACEKKTSWDRKVSQTLHRNEFRDFYFHSVKIAQFFDENVKSATIYFRVTRPL